MNELDTELMVLTVLSVLLWGLAFIYNQPFRDGGVRGDYLWRARDCEDVVDCQACWLPQHPTSMLSFLSPSPNALLGGEPATPLGRSGYNWLRNLALCHGPASSGC